MIGGFSNCKGILIYDTSIQGNNGVYGFYNDKDEMVILVDEYKKLRKMQTEDEIPYVSKEKEKQKGKLVWGLMFLYFMILLWSIWKDSFVLFLATFIFSVMSYFPILVFCFTLFPSYQNKSIFDQYRRYHGCEHTILNARSKKNKEWTISFLQKTSYLEAECGTVHSGQLLFFSVIVFWLILNSVYIGIIKTILLICVWIVLLFFNIFNPYNPFKLCQLYSVKKPSEKEYYLGLAIMEKFMQL